MYIIVCSIFSGNQVSRTVIEAIEIQDNSPQHGAISSYRFPLRFTGTNQLLHNDGGGLSAMGSVVRVDGRLIVRNNTASHGGGIHLEDHCVVWLCMSLCVIVCIMYMHGLCIYTYLENFCMCMCDIEVHVSICRCACAYYSCMRIMEHI